MRGQRSYMGHGSDRPRRGAPKGIGVKLSLDWKRLIEALERGLARLLMCLVASAEHARNFHTQKNDCCAERDDALTQQHEGAFLKAFVKLVETDLLPV